jgi:hypothetical protein
MQLENSSNKTRQEPTCASTKMVEHAEMWSQTEERSRAKRLLWFNLRRKTAKNEWKVYYKFPCYIHQNVPFKLGESETSRVKWQTNAAWGFKQQQVCNFSELPAKRYFLAI